MLRVGAVAPLARRLCLARAYCSVAQPYTLKSDVADALQSGKAVVGVESSAFALSLPYPANKQLAMDIVQAVKNAGAVAAIIGVLEGQVHVGMSERDIDKLVADKRPDAVSARNLAFAVTGKRSATATVSAALHVAELLGIHVVSTSSIGGVQQGGQESMDISADLHALSSSPVPVVCSGMSPVYDIPRSLEYLDTHCVTTLTLGDANDFPALMCRNSGSQSSGSLATAVDFARMVHIKKIMKARGGTLVAVPAPEHLAIPNDVYEAAVAQAEMEASYEDIHGEQLTEYLFKRVDEITEHSLTRTLRGLLVHNASVAAEFAVELARLQGQQAA